MRCHVRCACGHFRIVSLDGTMERIYRKMDLLERMRCPNCLEAAGCKLVSMPYAEYRNSYSACRTKQDSYDPEQKTISVYVPEDYAQNGSTAVDLRAEEVRAAVRLLQERYREYAFPPLAESLAQAEQSILAYLRKIPVGSAYTAACNTWHAGPSSLHPYGNDPVRKTYERLMDLLQ